jgi:hypothetical protein
VSSPFGGCPTCWREVAWQDGRRRRVSLHSRSECETFAESTRALSQQRYAAAQGARAGSLSKPVETVHYAAPEHRKISFRNKAPVFEHANARARHPRRAIRTIFAEMSGPHARLNMAASEMR